MSAESSKPDKDPIMMNSDIPVNRYDYLRKLSDEELLRLYSKYQERDVNPDSPSESQRDINDRIEHKDALIAIMNERHLTF